MTAEQIHPYSRPEARKGQVLDASEIKVGDLYTLVDLSGVRSIKVLTLPHRLEHLPNVEGLFIDVEEDTIAMHIKYPEIVAQTQKTRIGLSGYGVTPYESGKWNSTNYLLKASGK